MKIMVVSPHPDDETLGAGGTLIKYKKRGNNIYWLNVTDASEDQGWDSSFVEHRKNQIDAVKGYYHFDGFYNLRFSAAHLSSAEENELIAAIKGVFDEIKPEWIIIPGSYDAHTDHRVVYNCCMAAAKTFRSTYIKRVTTMEIISETEYGFQNGKFEPNFFVDITDEIDDKIRAMKIYDTEIEKAPFPRNLDNIRALASVRGGACATKYAEAFCIIKQIE